MEGLMETKENETKTLKNDLRESQKYCEIMAKKNIEMKKEYDKLFAAVSSQNKLIPNSIATQNSLIVIVLTN
jgi:hypothetical protein